MKWVLLSLSLYLLLVAFNVLFMMPGNYDWFNFVAAAVALSLAAVLAWLSIKRFKPDQHKQPQIGQDSGANERAVANDNEDSMPPTVPHA